MDALVTGVSTGIGRAAAKVLTGHGWRMFAGVRKAADADSLRREFGDKVAPLLFDVTDAEAVKAAAGEVRSADRRGDPPGADRRQAQGPLRRRPQPILQLDTTDDAAQARRRPPARQAVGADATQLTDRLVSRPRGPGHVRTSRRNV